MYIMVSLNIIFWLDKTSHQFTESVKVSPVQVSRINWWLFIVINHLSDQYLEFIVFIFYILLCVYCKETKYIIIVVYWKLY